MQRTTILLGLILGLKWTGIQGQVLTPPYFNLAEGRRIMATATCGEDISDESELYCKLAGANADADVNVNLIQGQVCDFCGNISGSQKLHPATYAIDGSERWWQSPPLSRGMKYNEVNLTIDLGQEFHVAYVVMTMANSPRPGVWVLERSSDNGLTYKPWQYFADSPGDCENYFGKESLQAITKDDSVTCDTTYSKVVPLEGGEVFVSLLKNRPSATNFFASDLLQEWTRATNVRLRLLRTKTLLGHLMSVARQDPTVTRRYFYSIKDISIGGRCRCNGHADTCDLTDPKDRYKLLCRCQHNTCGNQCERCCQGYVQKAWRISTQKAPFNCEPCNCYGHSEECFYDEEVDRSRGSVDMEGRREGGGVCTNCRDNTIGINCNECIPGYYRPYGKELNSSDVCQPCQCQNDYSTGNCEEGSGRCECREQFQAPNCDACSMGYYDFPTCKKCDCHFNGTRGEVCHVNGGQCPCKQNFFGKNCDQCAEGFYNFPECLPCECNEQGSVSKVCDPTSGQCECSNNFGGRQCHRCENGYWGFPNCEYCNCGTRGVEDEICDKETGNCLCSEGYGGIKCDQCLPSYYGYPTCQQCNCSTSGSQTTVCDAQGRCPCLHNFSGRMCDQCRAGYYKFPDCLSCECSSDGTMGVACDDAGKCQCKPSFDGIRCDVCKEGYYNFPLCEDCLCDPSGVVEHFSGCKDAPAGELCKCKERVQGRICNECKPLYWNLQHYNPLGCQDCNCYGPGILGGVKVCEGKSGQCPCKPHVVSQRCQECEDGYYNLQGSNLLGCSGCGCTVGGSVNGICDKISGACQCRPRISGKTCTEPLKTHYFPTLYQFQYESEDGTTRSGGQVRFGYDESIFPDYSWRGYAVYNELQPETNHDVYVEKSSLYRLVLNYVNPSNQTITGEILASPDSTNDVEQKFKVRFEPGGGLVTVSTGKIPSPLVLNPGRWRFSVKINQYLMIDYFTLLPAAYYEGSILQKRVNEPCVLNRTDPERDITPSPDPCVKFKYPSIDGFDSVQGANSHVQNSRPEKFYTDKELLEEMDLDATELVVLSPDQNKLEFDFKHAKNGRYALVVDYFTPSGAGETEITVESTSDKGKSQGRADTQNCIYSTLCRLVVTSDLGEVAVFPFSQGSTNVVLTAEPQDGEVVAIQSVTAIPLRRWVLDYIRPKEHCIVKDGSCSTSSYNLPPDSMKIEAEVGSPDRVLSEENMPAGVTDKKLVRLDNGNRIIEIPGRVPSPGYHKFLVHYYQPESPDFIVEVVLENGQHYEARVPVVHCPSTAGCRSLVAQDDKNSRFFIEDDFLLTLKAPKNVSIDYIVVVPVQYENEQELAKFLDQTPLDETRRFIEECGKNHMFLPRSIDGFCRDAVFSLTTDYNNGAVPCECSFGGSKSFECEEFGGQCQCKDNVIGRRCERCKTGFFGFPNCKPCNCPSTALCDSQTGACICPPRVIGEKCDTCAPLTYGFHALIGCEDCGCKTLGVQNGNLQCDQTTGKCSCRENVVGHTCDKCAAGYWAYPYCQLCDCDIRGSTMDVCNQDSAACYCKANVDGRNCEVCKVGSFNLEETNAAGCTKCFCFGKTTRCSSSPLFWTQITIPRANWTAASVDPNLPDSSEVIGYEVEFEEGSAEESDFVPVYIPEGPGPIPGNESNVIYFRGGLAGNFLASYGGILSYTVYSEPYQNADRETFHGPEVILEGQELPPSTKSIRLMHFAIDHLDGDHAMKMNLRVGESSFVVASPTGSLVAATRDQLMIVLKGLKAVHIRAAYWKKTRETRLADFGLTIGTEEYSPDERALSVERCQCPQNYIGLSCEECAAGFYRTPAGPFGGYCAPCECHGHGGNACDPVSGICTDCQHNTTGDHCETCQKGYHGDATQGTPYDCLICACPLPMTSNNFADSCELSYDGLEISCQCQEKYWGPRCESCSPGYYGRPEVPGDYCKPCECSGNIDVKDPSSCDTVTGACLKCMNNTGGPACNYCARGFFGDALVTKQCVSCNCNECGTKVCNSYSGDCECLPNVEGINCNRCIPDHYGLSSCDRQGCHYCDCGIAASSTQCDDATGQCPCKKGTTGLRCERCASGYFNYTEEGCQSCSCNSEYAIGVGCNPETGQCQCLPGVVGEKCDRCPYRWVLLEDRGCQACDSCQFQLLDDTDRMAFLLDPVKKEFDEVATSYFTTQRRTYFNNTAAALEPDVALLNPSKEDLNPYYELVGALELDAKTQKQKAEVTNESLRDKAKLGSKLREKAVEVESHVQEAVAKARTAVFETKDLMAGLLEGEKQSSPQTEAALNEAKSIVDALNKVKFSSDDIKAETEIGTQVLRNITNYVKPISGFSKEQQKQTEKIMSVRDKLKDIRNQSDYSVVTSDKANDISNKIKEARYPLKVSLLAGLVTDMAHSAGNASDLNEKTEEKADELVKSFRDLETVNSRVKELIAPLEQTTETLRNELEKNKDTIRVSNEHVRKLKNQADRLDDTFESSRGVSNSAVQAATAYQSIANALDEAHSLAKQAKLDSDNATEMTRGIGELAARAMEPSRNLLVLADQSMGQVDNDLKRPLEESKRSIDIIKDSAKTTNKSLASMEEELDAKSDLGDLLKSVDVSVEADSKAQMALERVEDVLAKLPKQESDAKTLPITVTDLNKGVQVSEGQLNQAKESIPLSAAITGSLEDKKPEFDKTKSDLGAQIADLKARIQTARELANRVPVGMNFADSSTLVLGNPSSLDTQQVQTKISLFFKTQEPQGLILFVGNEPGRKPENDFMAIEVESGNPVLTVDLGSGPQRYMILDKFVADDKWYKATVERSGRTIQFTVSEEHDGREIPYVKQDYYNLGGKSLFNVDRNSTKIFVGGFPPGQFRNPVKYSNFRGAVEDLMIGDEKVGLWNFRDAQNISPALGRESFIDLSPKRGLRFLGNGYAVLDRKQFPFVHRSAVSLKFQISAKNGLLFLVGKGKKFMSLEVVNGLVSFKYNLGTQLTNLTTPEPYNDGLWHTLSAVRDKKSGNLLIDNQLRARGYSLGDGESLSVSDYMYFGGYPGQHGYAEVTNKGFEGCIDEVMIDDYAVDLTKHVDTRDTMSGCPSSQVNSVATFYGDGYLMVGAGSPPTDGPVVSHPKDDVFELNFRFRSNESNGLIFYGADAEQNNYLSVSMADGILHIRTDPGETKAVTDPLNDGNWHVVTVTRDREKLMVNVDDTFEHSDSAPGGPLSLSTPNSLLLFGGRPEDYLIKKDATESEAPYKGCLGDININGKRIDFTDSQNQGSSVTQKCQEGEKPESIAEVSRTYAIPKTEEDGDEDQDEDEDGDEDEHLTNVEKDGLVDLKPEKPTPIPLITTTTTAAPRKRRPEEPVPDPFEQCKLPYRTRLPFDPDVPLEDGIRFGNYDRTSRLEYEEPKDDGVRSEYSIEFKTENPNGIILMKTLPDHSDLMAVYIAGGSIHFAFDSGAGIGLLNSSTLFDDGKWHTVSVSREAAYGELWLDGKFVTNGSSSGTTTSINAGTTLYVGGLSEQIWGRRFGTSRKISGVDTPFQGCLKNLLIRRRLPGEPTFRHSTLEACSEATEKGFSFYPNSGYLVLHQKFKVGRRIKFELSVRPRSTSGILVSVHGNSDYMILQMINGTVKFTVDNGKGPVSSSYTTEPYALCDGQWHLIQVSKAKNVVTLAVDKQYAGVGISFAHGVDITDTDHPLYLGGHPSAEGLAGFETTEQFVGCMKGLQIEGPRQGQLKFAHSAIVGNVGLHTCPAD